MNAKHLLAVAKSFQPAIASISLMAEPLDKRTRRNVCRAARALADSVQALPQSEARFSAEESSAELDALLTGYSALSGYTATAKSARVSRRMHLRAHVLSKRANEVLWALIQDLANLAGHEEGDQPCQRS